MIDSLVKLTVYNYFNVIKFTGSRSQINQELLDWYTYFF